MRTPEAGVRSTQWLIQYRLPAGEGATEAATWVRHCPDPTFPMGVRNAVQQLLAELREANPVFEWRAIRIESVQRIEEW